MWTKEGKLVDLELPKPLTKRLRIGSRHFVRNQVRKMWGALYKELRDSNDENSVRASRLVLMGVVFTEDYMTQYLDDFIPKTIMCVN